MSPNLARGDEVVKEANDTLVWGIRQNVTSETCIYFKMPTTKTKTTFKFWSITLLQSDPDVKITDDHGLMKTARSKTGVTIAVGQPLKLTIKATKNVCGNFSIPIRVEYEVLGSGQPITIFDTNHLVVRVTNSDIESLQPISKFVRPDRLKVRKFSKIIVPGIQWQQSSKMILKVKNKLDNYPLDTTLIKLLNQGLKEFPGMTDAHQKLLTDCRDLLKQQLTIQSYMSQFRFLLSCEEHQMNIDIRNFDLQKTRLDSDHSDFLSLNVPGLSENRPSLLRGDQIFVRVYPGGPGSQPENKEYEGIVHEIQQTRIRVGFSRELKERYVKNMLFDVRFTFSRFPLRNMHRALEFVDSSQMKQNWKSWLFPQMPADHQSKFSGKSSTSSLNLQVSRLMEENPEQKLAVSRIVEGGVPGVPYIIFGPPGTGKTFTLVEAIKQVLKKHPNSRVLATAPSNYAADHLASKLLDYLPPSEMLRFYANSRPESQVPDTLKPISNMTIAANSAKVLCNYRAIVVTVVTAGRIFSAGFPLGHFTHVFVDEAGHAMEPETLICLAGVLPPSGGQLILAGDPRQLGPVIRSPVAIKHGLELSLLERLMTRPIYLPDPNNGNRYNNHCITKLLANYRSHQKLIELPSRLFYNSELYVRGDPAMINSMLNWEHLPTKGFPIIFHGVYGTDKREARSPSFFNPEEASIIVEYVQHLFKNKHKIVPKDIGIISPYCKQVAKIRELLKNKLQGSMNNWQDIMIGSTEQFQGQERKIILISTVRSQVELLKEDFIFNLGFLQNPKRFNVALTRSKALLVVVGNPKLLWLDPHWKELIQFCQNNGGYTGVKFDSSLSHSSSGLLPGSGDLIPGSLEEMERKFSQMVLPKAHEFKLLFEPRILQDISKREQVEGAEWRGDI